MKKSPRIIQFAISLTLSLGLTIICLSVLTTIPIVVVHAANITVNSLADDIDDDGECTLREAINAANTDMASGAVANECAAGLGDDIIDLTGVNGTIYLSSTLPTITSNIILNGPGADSLTIDGGGNVRVFEITAGDVTISNLTIANGYIGPNDGHGGGIFNSSPGVVGVFSSTLSNNQARGADGQDAAYPNAASGCCFGGGGGIFHSGVGTLDIIYSTLTGNVAIGGNGGNGTYGSGGGGGGGAFGGGLFNDGGNIHIMTSTFIANQTVGGNGGSGFPTGSSAYSGGGGGGQGGGLGGGGQGGKGGKNGANGSFGGGGGGGGSGYTNGGVGGFGGGNGSTGQEGGGGGGAGLGAGIFNNSGYMSIVDSLFSDNETIGGLGGPGQNGPGENGQGGLHPHIFNWADLTLQNTVIPNTPPVLSYLPTNGATGLPLNQTLEWSASDVDGDWLTFDVAFGTSPDTIVETQDVVSPFIPPISLEYLTTYYWVITATDGLAVTSSGLVSFTTFAENYYVDAVYGNDSTGDGSSSSPWQTISYALSQVIGPDVEIHVASGMYDVALGESFPLTMKPGVSLIGAGYAETIISGDGSNYVLHFPSTAAYDETTVVSGFKITNGSEGIRIDGTTGSGSSPTIRENWITGNTNGIRNYTSSSRRAFTVIENNMISNNASYGIYDYAGASSSKANPRIEANEIVNNGSGGTYCVASAANYDTSTCSPLIIGNLISNNGGSGVTCQTSYAGSCSPQLIANTISNNQGWGLQRIQGPNYNAGSNPKLINNLIVDNTSGGAYFIFYYPDDRIDKPLLVNNTIANNNTYGVASGLPTIVNSIIWGHNDDLDVSVSNVSYSNVGDGEYGGINNNISSDPQFVDPTYGDYHLLPTSPARDSGNSAHPDLTATDIDGEPRIIGSAVDMGVDESQLYGVSIDKSVVATGPVGLGDVVTYTLAVTNLSSFTANGVLVTDTLPSETVLTDFIQPDVGQVSISNGTLTWLSTLPQNDTQSLTFTVTMSPTSSVGWVITNTATVADRSGGFTETVPITLPTKPTVFWATSDQYVNHTLAHPEQTLVYTITLRNTGNVEATNVTVADTLDSNVTFATASAGGIFSGGQVAWSGLTIPIDGQMTMTASVTINTPLANGTTLVNQVSVTSDGQPAFNLSNDGATTVVYNQPQANFSGTPEAGIVPLLVNFSNSSLYATSYRWDFGDGSISFATNPSHLYLDGGVYTVTLKAFNPSGSDTLTHASYITVYDVPIANFYATPTTGLTPLVVTFTNTSQYADSYLWDYGDGLTSTTTSQLHQHTYTSSGVYTISLIASSPYGSDVQTRTNYITVYDTPVASFSGTPLSGVAPLQVDFNNSSINATSYYWDFGDETYSFAANPTHYYTNGGTYTVTLTAANPADSDILIRPAYITVYNGPMPDFYATPTTGLIPLVVTFTNTSQYADSYLWDYGDGNTGNSSVLTHTHSYSMEGAYTVTLTATNAYGVISKTRVAYINVFSTPVPDFDAEPKIGPVPLNVTFSNSSIGADEYLWSFGDGSSSTASNPTHMYNASGFYTVTLTASNPASSATITRSNYITAYDMPQADFSGTPVIGSVPLIVSFTNNSQNADEYEWDYGDGITSTVSDPVHNYIYTTPGLYTVSLKAVNVYTEHLKVIPGYIIVYSSPPPTDFYVDAINGDDTFGDGTQMAPWKTISRALSLLKNPGMKIHIAPGLYDEALGESFPLNIPPGISLIGSGRDTTFISGPNTASVLYIGSETTNGNIISKLTVQNGNVGLDMHTTAQQTIAPIIADVRLRWNGIGIRMTTGEVYQDGASITAIISNTEVVENSQTGVYMRSYGYFSPSSVTPTIIDSIVQGNGGHGIQIDASATSANGTTAAPHIINTRIIENGGHGIYASGTYQGWIKSQVDRSWIENNGGYGFYWQQGINSGNINASIYNTMIVRNQAGGLYLGDSRTGGASQMKVINCTFAANANYGIYWKRGSTEVSPTVINTILWNTFADDLYSSGGAWATGQIQYSVIEDGNLDGLGGNLSQDPLLLSDYHLVFSSPAVDAGDSTLPDLSEIDFDGDPRILGAGVDIGADEFNNSIPSSGGTLALAPGVTMTADSGVFSDTILINYASQPITPTGTLSNVGLFYELSAVYLSSGLPAEPQPGQIYTIIVTYQQEDVPAEVNEADLALYYWDGEAWVEEPTSLVDVNANTITATPDHLSLWAALADGNHSSSQKVFLPILLKP